MSPRSFAVSLFSYRAGFWTTKTGQVRKYKKFHKFSFERYWKQLIELTESAVQTLSVDHSWYNKSYIHNLNSYTIYDSSSTDAKL